MPQSLMVTTPSGGGATKRYRSADGREPQPRSQSADPHHSSKASSKHDRYRLNPNVKMPTYLEKSKSEILSTFQEIEWKQRFRLFHAMEHPDTSPFKVDRSEVVVSRNRYGNVQPWDASRIKLKTPIGGSDYVNASPIILKSKSSSSNDDQPELEVKYIATQGPKQGQKSHFWHMVHQEIVGDTGVIIMLTQLVEENKEKCSQYYPAELDQPFMTLPLEEDDSTNGAKDETETGDDSEVHDSPTDSFDETGDNIKLISKEFDEAVLCEVRKFVLTINDVPKNIVHYLFGRWPDFGKPEAADRKALVELSRRSYAEAGDSPRVVHCSAGVGRTGTWIALDFLIREVQEDRLLSTVKSDSEKQAASREPLSGVETWGNSGPPKANTPTQEDGFEKDEHDLIYDTVNSLREQRMMMVIREVQFSFLYEAVREAVLEKYRQKPEGAVVQDSQDFELRPRRRKAPRRSEDNEATTTTASDAETEIMDTDVQQSGTQSDQEDPYSAVSPDYVRKGMSQER